MLEDHLMTPVLSSMVEKHSSGERSDVAVGLRPSGVIHLGNMAALALAGYLSKEIGPHLSQVNVTVCDLDMPDASDWSVSDKGFMRYFGDLPAPQGSSESTLLDHAVGNLREFTTKLEDQLGGVKYDLQLLSDVQSSPDFRTALKRVLDEPELTRELIGAVPNDRRLVYPLCNECGTSNGIASEYDNGILSTSCGNGSCEVGDYQVDVLDPTFDLAVHYFIDPLRDRAVDPKSSIHVFGGDYREGAEGRPTKIDRILKVLDIAGEGDVPDIFMGPIFYARDGTKMSKSKDNGLNMDQMRNHFGDDYPSRIMEVVTYISQEGYKNVDYQIVEDVLFRE